MLYTVAHYALPGTLLEHGVQPLMPGDIDADETPQD